MEAGEGVGKSPAIESQIVHEGIYSHGQNGKTRFVQLHTRWGAATKSRASKPSSVRVSLRTHPRNGDRYPTGGIRSPGLHRHRARIKTSVNANPQNAAKTHLN